MEIVKHEIKTLSPEDIEASELKSLKLRYNSLVEGVKLIEGENHKLRNHIDLMEQKLIHAQTNVDINKKIVENALLKQNDMKNSMEKDIVELHAKLKAAKAALK